MGALPVSAAIRPWALIASVRKRCSHSSRESLRQHAVSVVYEIVKMLGKALGGDTGAGGRVAGDVVIYKDDRVLVSHGRPCREKRCQQQNGRQVPIESSSHCKRERVAGRGRWGANHMSAILIGSASACFQVILDDHADYLLHVSIAPFGVADEVFGQGDA